MNIFSGLAFFIWWRMPDSVATMNAVAGLLVA